MEESGGDVLMSRLIESGVSIPGDFSSVSQFTSEALTSICAQLLNLIDPSENIAVDSQYMIFCTDIAHSVKNLGFVGDITYYKFLHPSQDDSRNLVTFLLERLSQKEQGNIITTSPAKVDDDIHASSRPKLDTFRDVSDDETFDMHLQKVEAVLKDLTMTPHAENVSHNGSTVATDEPSLIHSSGYEEHSSIHPSQTNTEAVELQNQHNLLLEELESGSSELRSLDSELELFTMAAEKLLDQKQPGGLYLQQLNEHLLLKRRNIMDLKKQWDHVRLTLETKKLRLLDQLHVEAKEKFHKLKKTELDLQSLSSDIQKREEERFNLYTELEKQPKAAPRKSYIHGIKEITKNSRKLDSDIQRISGETRELQLESNSIRERLHRSYAVVDEMVTREMKKDPAIRQVYKLVTSIHGIFEQISEKILVTDRLRREAVDYEKKLGSITSRGLSLEKLQADLDAIRQENESLEKQLN
ncbi:Coiled-coil protein [Hirschfeldia incana]|nr:Coiled-coil protein [Hirschfeldia incana]